MYDFLSTSKKAIRTLVYFIYSPIIYYQVHFSHFQVLLLQSKKIPRATLFSFRNATQFV